MDDLKIIREHICRSVTHIAREHQATDNVVWQQMILEAIDHLEGEKIITVNKNINES